MTKITNIRVQHLILTVSGQKPTVPFANTMPNSPNWRWSDIMEGELAWNRPDNIWYYRNGSTIKVFGSAPPEVITPELTAAYNPDKPNDPETGYAYIAGSDFVTYVNESSTDPDFQTLQIYLCIVSALIGESPETHPAKWERKGDSVEIYNNSLSQIFFANETEIKAITNYKNGNNVVNLTDGAILKYDVDATSGIQPNDNSAETGRWVQVGTMGGGGGVTEAQLQIINDAEAHMDGADEQKHTSNQIIHDAQKLSDIIPQLVNISEIDVSDINVGEKKIVVAVKSEAGLAEFGGAIGLLDMIANPGVDTLLAETAAWIADEITLTGNNLQGSLGENSQIYPGQFDFFVCISHITGTTTSNGSATWRRYRSMDCLNYSVTQHAAIIDELEVEIGWNSIAQYKTITSKSKRGTWYRRNTGGYLYMCIDDSNGWTRLGTPPTIELEITSTSHPVLTASLTANDWSTTPFYLEGTNSSDEPAEQGQEWWDTTNFKVYRRNMNGYWARLN